MRPLALVCLLAGVALVAAAERRSIILDDSFADRPTFLPPDVLALLPHDTLTHTETTGKIHAHAVKHLGRMDSNLRSVLSGTSQLPTSVRRPDQDFRYRQVLAETQSAVRRSLPTPIRSDNEEASEPVSDAERIMRERQMAMEAMDQRMAPQDQQQLQQQQQQMPMQQQFEPSPYADPYSGAGISPYGQDMRFQGSSAPAFPSNDQGFAGFGNAAPPPMQLSSGPQVDQLDDEETTPAQMAMDEQMIQQQQQQQQQQQAPWASERAPPPRFAERAYGRRMTEEALRGMPEQNGPYQPSRFFPGPARSRALRAIEPPAPRFAAVRRESFAPLPPNVMRDRMERARMRRAADGRDGSGPAGFMNQQQEAPESQFAQPDGGFNGGSLLEEDAAPAVEERRSRRVDSRPSIAQQLGRNTQSDDQNDFSLAETTATSRAREIPGADEDMAMGDSLDAVEAASDEFMPSVPQPGRVMSARDAGVPSPPPMEPSPAQLERAHSAVAVEPIEHYEPPRPPQLA